jgi:hypothetical protein
MTDYASLSDADLMAAYKKAKDPFESALAAEGATGKVADIARSIYTQESGGGKNTKTSNAGAMGGMQIIPDTFKSVADKDWNINDPQQNARAGIRYVKQLYDQAGGDPALTAAGYYGGPGGLEKARRGVAVSDPRNPDAPTTLQYGQQVAARLPKTPLNPVMAAGKAITDAIIPSANAAEVPAQQPESPYAKMSDEELLAAYKKMQPAPGRGVMGKVLDAGSKAWDAVGTAQQATKDYAKGLIGGAAGIGNTIINAASVPVVPNGPNGLINPETQAPAVQAKNADRQAGLAAYTAEQPKTLPYEAGKLTSEIAGTAGVGGALAAPVKAVAPVAGPVVGNLLTKFGNALGSSGMTVGGAPATTAAQGAGNLALRAAGGYGSGYASAGLIDPSTANTGGMINAAVPVVSKAAGLVGNALGKAVSGGQLAPEVVALADRAKQLGIDIPADRLVNSKPLNALASSLNYVPLSGRAGTERKMQDQLNTALSRTFGQDSDNVTMALRKASGDLGDKFDKVLQSNTVKIDPQFMQDVADAGTMASKELGSEGAGIINKQIDEILAKGQSGEIDGQAAYNIKKTLDRISNRNSPEAFYARDLKQKLMGALDRSLGPQEAADFAAVRKQYGNMLSLENLAQNGAEGDISIARLANMKNINNPDLQELADISAQFLKGREGQHGSAQRVFGGLGAAGSAGTAAVLGVPAVPLALGAGIAAGRGANMLLNSNMVKSRLLGAPSQNLLANTQIPQLMYRAAPVAGTQ